MHCTRCAHENRPQAKFCAGCGAALSIVCARCGAVLPEAARFCDACGTAAPGAPPASPRFAPAVPTPGSYTPRHLAEKILTSRSALEGERKQVTVLFADVAGFTALSTRLDPEELHTVMDGCFQRVLDAVHRFEGTVNQFTGDGVMALFGAPIAHEDHAVRAVAAALEIQSLLVDYAADLRRGGIEFGLRIGLNTGPVVVGRIGDDLRMDYTAQGETVNLAARLQAAGEAGTVWVSAATHRLAKRQFTAEDRGELSVKGIDRPVRAFVITGELRRHARFDAAIERGLTPLIGRRRALQFLDDCFERARAGRGQAVSIVGDAGVGKSRLAYEFRQRLSGEVCRFLRAGCMPHGERAPFRVVVDLLRGSLELEDGTAEAAQVAHLEAAIASLDGGLAWTLPYAKLLLALPASELDAEGLDPVQRKRRTLEAVRALLLGAAAQKPLVLLVEDLQWVDVSSEEVMLSLVDGLSERRVLLLCTYRTGHVPAWHERSFHQRVALESLSPQESAELAERLISASGSSTLRDLVVSRGEGNPFFLEELAAYLRPAEGESAAARLSRETGVPETIRDLLSARIDRLAERAKGTLQRAAVLGAEFPLRLLEAIGPPGEDVREDVEDLVACELLHETQLVPEPRLSFSPELIRDVAYEGLLLRSRAELHGRAGAALERLHHGRIDEALLDVARHYARSHEHGKAVHYLMRAGDRAANLFAYDEAQASYRDALRIVEEAALGEDRSTIHERMGDTAFAKGEIEASLDHWAAALEARPSSADASSVAELHRKRAVALWAAGRTSASLVVLEEGLAALGEDGDNLAAARIYQELARFHFRRGEIEPARRWADRALALGERLGAPDVVAHAYNTLGVAEARAGDLAGGAATVHRGLDTALAHGLAAIACRAYTNLAVINMTLDHERSAEYCREGLKLARRIGDQLQQSWLHCSMAGGHCTLAGDYDEGVKSAEAAIELDRRLGQKSHLPIPIIILAQIYQCRGDHVRSAERYREALVLAEEIGEPQLRFPCYDGLATLAIESGDEAEADRWLARSREVQETAGWTSDSFFVVPFLC